MLYYLFLDYPESLTPNDNLAKYYADEIDMPTGFRQLVDGFHALDRMQLNEGLVHLCHPAVSPTYPEKIIDTFLHANIRHKHNTLNNHSNKTSNLNGSSNRLQNGSASLPPTPINENNYSAAIAYITAKSPALVSPKSINVYISTLCSASVYTALNFTRAVSDITLESNRPSVKTSLLTALVNACLTSSALLQTQPSPYPSSSSATSTSSPSLSPSTASSPSRPRKNPLHNLFQGSSSAWRLANLPFTPSESQVIESILNDIIAGSSKETSSSSEPSTTSHTPTSHGHGHGHSSSGILERRKAALAKDVLLLRALHTGDMESASKVAAMKNFKLSSTSTIPDQSSTSGHFRNLNTTTNGGGSLLSTITPRSADQQQGQEQRPVEWADISRGLSLGLNA